MAWRNNQRRNTGWQVTNHNRNNGNNGTND